MLGPMETAIALQLLSMKVREDRPLSQQEAETSVINAVHLARVFSRLADGDSDRKDA